MEKNKGSIEIVNLIKTALVSLSLLLTSNVFKIDNKNSDVLGVRMADVGCAGKDCSNGSGWPTPAPTPSSYQNPYSTPVYTSPDPYRSPTPAPAPAPPPPQIKTLGELNRIERNEVVAPDPTPPTTPPQIKTLSDRDRKELISGIESGKTTSDVIQEVVDFFKDTGESVGEKITTPTTSLKQANEPVPTPSDNTPNPYKEFADIRAQEYKDAQSDTSVYNTDPYRNIAGNLNTSTDPYRKPPTTQSQINSLSELNLIERNVVAPKLNLSDLIKQVAGNTKDIDKYYQTSYGGGTDETTGLPINKPSGAINPYDVNKYWNPSLDTGDPELNKQLTNTFLALSGAAILGPGIASLASVGGVGVIPIPMGYPKSPPPVKSTVVASPTSQTILTAAQLYGVDVVTFGQVAQNSPYVKSLIGGYEASPIDQSVGIVTNNPNIFEGVNPFERVSTLKQNSLENLILKSAIPDLIAKIYEKTNTTNTAEYFEEKGVKVPLGEFKKIQQGVQDNFCKDVAEECILPIVSHIGPIGETKIPLSKEYASDLKSFNSLYTTDWITQNNGNSIQVELDVRAFEKTIKFLNAVKPMDSDALNSNDTKRNPIVASVVSDIVNEDKNSNTPVFTDNKSGDYIKIVAGERINIGAGKSIDVADEGFTQHETGLAIDVESDLLALTKNQKDLWEKGDPAGISNLTIIANENGWVQPFKDKDKGADMPHFFCLECVVPGGVDIIKDWNIGNGDPNNIDNINILLDMMKVEVEVEGP
jgi:hypothetical protein